MIRESEDLPSHARVNRRRTVQRHRVVCWPFREALIFTKGRDHGEFNVRRTGFGYSFSARRFRRVIVFSHFPRDFEKWIAALVQVTRERTYLRYVLSRLRTPFVAESCLPFQFRAVLAGTRSRRASRMNFELARCFSAMITPCNRLQR